MEGRLVLVLLLFRSETRSNGVLIGALVSLLFRSETLSSGGLIGSCVAVTPFGGTQQ